MDSEQRDWLSTQLNLTQDSFSINEVFVENLQTAFYPPTRAHSYITDDRQGDTTRCKLY